MRARRRLRQLGNILLVILGFLLMVMPVIWMFEREEFLPFLFVAVLVCPLWYLCLRRGRLRHRDRFAWTLRGICLVSGLILQILFNSRYPLRRDWNFVTKERMETYFLEQVATEDMEYREVGSVGKQDNHDYCILTSQVVYLDKRENRTRGRKVVLYYDKYTAWYYDRFEDMKEDRKARMAKGARECQLFDGDQVDGRLNEITDAFVDNRYDRAQLMMNTELQKKVTVSVWNQWQEQSRAMGEFREVDIPIDLHFETVESGAESQLLHATETLKYTEGELNLKVTLYDDLSMKELEICNVPDDGMGDQ